MYLPQANQTYRLTKYRKYFDNGAQDTPLLEATRELPLHKVGVCGRVPNSPYSFCGRKATLKKKKKKKKNQDPRAQGLCESRGGRPGLPVPNSP